MRFDIITIFPKIFDSYLNESLIRRARDKKIIDVRVHNLRDFAEAKTVKGRRDPRRQLDDKPFGGGPGMVIKIEPIYRAVQFLKSKTKNKKLKTRTILFSTRGKKLDARTAKRLAKHDRLILICGRYEGVDERVAEHVADEEISIGDYILSGGELPALVLMEAVSRYLPGFLGKTESLEEINGSFPTYTRPEMFWPGSKKLEARSEREKRGRRAPKNRFLRNSLRNPPLLSRANRKIIKRSGTYMLGGRGTRWAVPQVLLSGDHKKIDEWRRSRG